MLLAGIFAVPLSLLKSGTAHAAINRVSSAACNTGSSAATQFSCTISAPSDGNVLIAFVGVRSTSFLAASGITQTGASWTAGGQATNTNGIVVNMFYTTSLSSASTSLIVSMSGTFKASAIIAEYSGVDTSGGIDQSDFSSTGSSASPVTGTTPTTTSPNEFWVGGLGNNNTTTYSLETNGFTEITESASGGGSSATRNNLVMEEKMVSSTGTASVGATLSGTQQWSAGIATFPAKATPTQIVFSTTARTLTAGTCSGAANVITIELRDGSNNPTAPSGSTVINISSSSPAATFYSDSSCSTQISGGNITFTTSDTAKSFYVIDTHKSSPTWTFTASKQSGPETLSNGTQGVTINAGAVTRLVVTLPGQSFTDGTGNSGSVTNQTAGSSFTITKISATDDYFNVNTSYSGAKTLAYSGPGNAPNSTAPAYTTSVSFTSGQSTTALTSTLYKAETTTITVTDGGSYGYASSSFLVNPGTVSNYAVIGATPTIAGVCATANSITARDQYNNTMGTDTSVVNMTTTGTGITFYTASGCGTTTTQYTLSSGTAAFYFKSNKKQSGFTITATKNLDTPTGTTSSLAIDPAATSAILVQLPGQSFTDGTGITGSSNFTGLRTPNATAGTSFSVTLKAVDSFNNLVDTGTNNYTGSKTISWTNSIAGNAPDSTAPSFPGSVSFTNGSTGSLSLTYYNAATGRTVRADDTATPVTGTASSTFTVQANNANSFTVAAGATQTAGIAFNVTITAVDAKLNPLGSLYSAPAGSYAWSTTASNAPDSTAPSTGSLVQGNFSNGVATKSVTLYKAESGVTITAGEPSPSTVTGTSSAITINAGSISGAAADSSVSGNTSVFQNASLTVTITLLDTWHNPKVGVAAANITVSATGTPSITQPSSATDSSGQTTTSLSWTNLGVQTVSVQISGVSLVQNDGSTADSDGYLDDTHIVTVSLPAGSSTLMGGTTIHGGTKLQ